MAGATGGLTSSPSPLGFCAPPSACAGDPQRLEERRNQARDESDSTADPEPQGHVLEGSEEECVFGSTARTAGRPSRVIPGCSTFRIASVPARGIQHIDLAVGDVERSLAFYHGVLGPLGLKEKFRIPTYRQTEEVVYLELGVQGFGLRPADGGAYRYHAVGIEHLAFEVDDRAEVDAAYERCVAVGGTIQSPPEAHYVDDGEDYFGFFAFDPDGIRIEVFCWPTSPYH